MVNSGLEGITAATTRLSHVDGEGGELIIAGYQVGELAEQATFEEAPTFAVSGISGWIAHAVEQRNANRIIRPQSEYSGPRGRRWVQLSNRRAG